MPHNPVMNCCFCVNCIQLPPHCSEAWISLTVPLVLKMTSHIFCSCVCLQHARGTQCTVNQTLFIPLKWFAAVTESLKQLPQLVVYLTDLLKCELICTRCKSSTCVTGRQAEWLAVFCCFKQHIGWAEGPHRGATSPFTLYPKPRERSLSSGESSHKNAESCLALETSCLCTQAWKDPPLPLRVNTRMEAQGRCNLLNKWFRKTRFFMEGSAT